jgi:hypothetical protein
MNEDRDALAATFAVQVDMRCTIVVIGSVALKPFCWLQSRERSCVAIVRLNPLKALITL